MNRDPENFESLRRLLAWKKHEQPPPGYFHDFSRRVMARIEAGEEGTDPAGFRAWLLRFWSAMVARPAFAGAFGTAVCAFLVVGLVSSEEMPNNFVYHPDPAMNQTVGVTSTSDAEPHTPTLGSSLLAGTNVNESLAALFNQSYITENRVSTPHSLLEQH